MQGEGGSIYGKAMELTQGKILHAAPLSSAACRDERRRLRGHRYPVALEPKTDVSCLRWMD